MAKDVERHRGGGGYGLFFLHQRARGQVSYQTTRRRIPEGCGRIVRVFVAGDRWALDPVDRAEGLVFTSGRIMGPLSVL
jgi:hypothetical protein